MEHFKSPFEVDDLASERAVENREFFDGLVSRARSHRLFTHPFIRGADEAMPSAPMSSILTSFYGIVAPFTGLLCLLGGHAPSLRSRFALMDNIYEEMGCGDLNSAHPRLYLRMLASIGVSEQVAESFPALPSVRRINQHLHEVVEQRPFSVACAVLDCAEATIPATFPAMANKARSVFREIDTTFFDRHGVRDEGHSADASMLFSITATQPDFVVAERDVQIDLDLRSDLFDEWMATISEGVPARSRSGRPPGAERQSVPPPA
jgi:pyrroloquinoline quinone (PQQ) biosynthesis protein C